MNLDLAAAEAFVFDVDGTLVLSDDPNAADGGIQVLSGAVEVLQRLRARGTPFVCFTNGSSQPPRVVGKPSGLVMEMVAARLGTSMARMVVVVGDLLPHL